MPKGHRITPDVVDAILHGTLADMTAPALAALFGIAPETVRRVRRDRGVYRRPDLCRAPRTDIPTQADIAAGREDILDIGWRDEDGVWHPPKRGKVYVAPRFGNRFSCTSTDTAGHGGPGFVCPNSRKENQVMLQEKFDAIRARVAEAASDGKITLPEGFRILGEIVDAAAWAVRALKEPAELETLITDCEAFYDQVVQPLDLKAVPDWLERSVVDPMLRRAIRPSITALYEALAG